MEKLNEKPEKIRQLDFNENIPTEMYEISGFSVNLKKYLESKRKWDESIESGTKFKLNLINEVEACLAANDIETQLEGLEMLYNRLPYEEHDAYSSRTSNIVEKALGSSNREIKLRGVEMIRHVFSGSKAYFIEKVLKENVDNEIKIVAIKAIRWIPDKEEDPLLKLAIKLIDKALDSRDLKTQLDGARMIHNAPLKNNKQTEGIYKKAKDIIENALASDDIEKQLCGIEMIPSIARVNNWIDWVLIRENIIKPIIEKVLTSQRRDIQIRAIGVINLVLPLEKIAELIEIILNSEDPEIQAKGIELIKLTPEESRQKLIEIAIKKGLAKEIIKPPLYTNQQEIGDNKFVRRSFDKTGSNTTLIGGQLKDKIIIRHIEPKAFMAWQRLYEDWKLWKEAGFDYVPIEPIQSYRFNAEKNLVEVATGVLDLNLHEWEKRTNKMFLTEIERDKEKILEVLETVGFKHGHAHSANFVLRFYRNETGEPDLYRTPRLYLIDFDQAVSPPKDI